VPVGNGPDSLVPAIIARQIRPSTTIGAPTAEPIPAACMRSPIGPLAQHPSQFLGDGRESLLRRALTRDQRRHAAQGGLLLGQRGAHGHVPRDAVHDAEVRHRARVPLESACRAVGADEAALESDDVLAGGQNSEHVVSALHVIGMDNLHERPRHELLARVAQHAFERRVTSL
jgi:hypothetical protein